MKFVAFLLSKISSMLCSKSVYAGLTIWKVTCDKRTVYDGDSTVELERQHAFQPPPASGDPCNFCMPSGSFWRHDKALSVRDRIASICWDPPHRCHRRFRHRSPSWLRNRSCRSICAHRSRSVSNTDCCERYHCRQVAIAAAETHKNQQW